MDFFLRSFQKLKCERTVKAVNGGLLPETAIAGFECYGATSSTALSRVAFIAVVRSDSWLGL